MSSLTPDRRVNLFLHAEAEIGLCSRTRADLQMTCLRNSSHVEHIQMRVVPSELHTNIQSGVVCRCIKEEDGIYH